ncbi:MFS general substrate transporter [Lentinus tigrinus ALCF2SS1-7]|uniref:MFS general substrate transporter n=1 Tax=Lentinus tigrinus ALCF2SS1-6 TaxID=1328759 RepID=A0A5C2SB96_9APHY|nr:MFS general substrate transporter [Lentinus tigrinus ALCF2SS1-6]RPD75787.1 MFS general substrate transporter [Lentinus tigrinus ALCF2SS1-7]
MSDKGAAGTESRSESPTETVAASIQQAALKGGDVPYGGEDTLPPPPTLTAEEEKRLWRKIDVRLVPILTLMYLCSFLDRGNIGNAKLQGLTTQLNLTGNKYNIALTMYYIPYCLFECPANLVLKKIRPSRWLPGITVVWGTVMTLMGLVKNYPQLIGTRICLGVAEAGLFPGVVFYLSLWYPRHMLQYRIGIFFGGATLAGAFSGLLAFGISFMSGTAGLLGWSWIFIIEGLITVVVGAIAFFVVVDFPHTATFLTPEERAWVVHRKKYDNSSVGEEEHFELRHVWETLLDWQVWAHILLLMSIIAPSTGISLFLPSIIHGFGFDVPISQLLTVPPYVFAAATLLVWAVWSDHIKKRWPFVLAGLLYCLVGFAINISDVSFGVKYFGTFLAVAGAYAGFPGVIAWLGNNLAGQYKRGVGMALQIGMGNFGAVIASNIYRSQDAPRYVLGNGLELMFIGIGLIVLPLTVLNYKRINARRDADETGMQLSPEEIRRLGDRAPDFRYTM